MEYSTLLHHRSPRSNELINHITHILLRPLRQSTTRDQVYAQTIRNDNSWVAKYFTPTNSMPIGLKIKYISTLRVGNSLSTALNDERKSLIKKHRCLIPFTQNLTQDIILSRFNSIQFSSYSAYYPSITPFGHISEGLIDFSPPKLMLFESQLHIQHTIRHIMYWNVHTNKTIIFYFVYIKSTVKSEAQFTICSLLLNCFTLFYLYKTNWQ